MLVDIKLHIQGKDIVNFFRPPQPDSAYQSPSDIVASVNEHLLPINLLGYSVIAIRLSKTPVNDGEFPAHSLRYTIDGVNHGPYAIDYLTSVPV